MKTQIFKNYGEFLSREDKTLNGVSQSFANENKNFESDNESNKGCWNCRRCSSCSSCSSCSYCSYCSDCSSCSYCSDCSSCSSCSSCSYCSDCSSCSSCSYCSDCSSCSSCSYCSYCSDCSSCSSCSDCSDCSDCSNLYKVRNKQNERASGDEVKTNPLSNIPVIENIHQKVLDAVSIPDALNMGSWHTCDTTHCRAGWVIHLAGKLGYDLEKATTTQFAANQIYKASSEIRVSPYHYFETNEQALNHIKECAEQEKELNK